jgi:tetratricopeptide (TPR) repeat protein
MLDLLGRVYLNLGRGDQAISILESAVDASRAAFGPSVDLAEAMGRLGFALDQHGDRQRGETLIRQALEMATEVTDERSETTAHWQEFLGRALMDSRQLDEAEPYLRAAYETRLALDGADDPMVARSLNALGSLYSLRGDQDRATETTEQVLGIFERAGLAGSPDYAITESNLALMYDRSGRLEDADRAATDAVAKLGATMGPSHFLTASTKARLAEVRGRLGRTDEADSIYREAIGTLEQVGANNVAFPVTLGNYATFLRNAGRALDAEAMGRRDLAAAARIVGEDHPVYAGALMRVGNAVRDQGRIEEAVALHTRARDTFTATLGPEHPQTQAASVALARSWMANGDPGAAETLLVETLDQATSVRGTGDPIAISAREALIELYESQGRSEDARRLREAGAEA